MNLSEKTKGNLIVTAWIVTILLAVPVLWINWKILEHYFNLAR